MYGHVITKFSGMGRFTYPWCSAGALRAPELRYKALLNILTSDKLDTVSSKFYQHHNFYNLCMSSPGKKDVTNKSMERVVAV